MVGGKIGGCPGWATAIPIAINAAVPANRLSLTRFMLRLRFSARNILIIYRESIIMSNGNDGSIRRAAYRLRIIVFITMALMVLIYIAAGLGLQFGHAHVEYRSQGIGAPYAQWIGGG